MAWLDEVLQLQKFFNSAAAWKQEKLLGATNRQKMTDLLSNATDDDLLLLAQSLSQTTEEFEEQVTYWESQRRQAKQRNGRGRGG